VRKPNACPGGKCGYGGTCGGAGGGGGGDGGGGDGGDGGSGGGGGEGGRFWRITSAMRGGTHSATPAGHLVRAGATKNEGEASPGLSLPSRVGRGCLGWRPAGHPRVA
jgi:hypothetical protein